MPTKYQGTIEAQRALDTYIKLQRAADTVLIRTNTHLASHDLTISQFGTLEALHFLGTLSQRDLAQKLLKSTGNISVVLKKLEQRGLIARTRDPLDNRYMQVCITDAGRNLLLSFFDQHVQGIMDTFSVLTPQEQDNLAALCRKLGLHAAKSPPN